MEKSFRERKEWGGFRKKPATVSSCEALAWFQGLASSWFDGNPHESFMPAFEWKGSGDSEEKRKC